MKNNDLTFSKATMQLLNSIVVWCKILAKLVIRLLEWLNTNYKITLILVASFLIIVYRLDILDILKIILQI